MDATADWLDGAIDVHVHSGPSFFPRWGSAPAVVDACAAAGMHGVVLKAHEGSTTEVAAALAVTHAPLSVFGGVVLNRYVGGLNPAAVEAAIRLGARCIWLPTIDAADHVRAYGSTGTYAAQSGGSQDTDGLSLTGDDGTALTPAVREILALVRDADVALATGHVAAHEVALVVEACRELGHRRLLVQHPCFSTPALSSAAIEAHARDGALIELTYLSVSPMWQETTIDRCVEIFCRVGRDGVVLSSDAGQRHSPAPPEALRSFAQALHERGIPADWIRAGLVENPRRLIAP